jgi:hypothetical protein
MSGQKIATSLEIFVVTTGMIALGSLGAFVTPKEGTTSDRAPLEPRSERVIVDARSGYDLDTCVRDISPRTVLSESVSGAPEFIVLEGAPVTECFPELAQFMELDGEKIKSDGGATARSKGDQGSFGADMKTSVTVLSPNVLTVATSTTGSSAPEVSTTATSGVVLVSETKTAPEVVIPSGGSTRESALDLGVVPPLDRFDACRMSMFGQSVPTALTDAETASFEACLSAEFPPTIGE